MSSIAKANQNHSNEKKQLRQQETPRQPKQRKSRSYERNRESNNSGGRQLVKDLRCREGLSGLSGRSVKTKLGEMFSLWSDQHMTSFRLPATNTSCNFQCDRLRLHRLRRRETSQLPPVATPDAASSDQRLISPVDPLTETNPDFMETNNATGRQFDDISENNEIPERRMSLGAQDVGGGEGDIVDLTVGT